MTNLVKSDYLWVEGANVDTDHPYGDMDRLKTSFNLSDTVRGVIMPQRTGNTSTGVSGKKVMSGEDICFLVEGAAERRALTTRMSTQEKYTFSRIVGSQGNTSCSAQVAALRLHSHVTSFVKSIQPSGTYDLTSDNVIESYQESELLSNTGDYISGQPLTEIGIMNLFNDEKMLDLGFVKEFPDGSEKSWGTQVVEIRKYNSQDYDPFIPNDDGIFWDGGEDGRRSHQDGGQAKKFRSLNVTLTLNGLPDGYVPEQGNAIVLYQFKDEYWPDPGSQTITNTSYLTTTDTWTRNGNSFTFAKTNSQLKAITEQVALQKFGWDTTASLPDAYGYRYLYLDGATVWFTFPVSSHTKWWT